jgi:hypothetical protein
MYSRNFFLSRGRSSPGERSSATKSGQIVANPCSLSERGRANQRSSAIHEASGERTAEFGRVKPAEESKTLPRPLRSFHTPSRIVSRAFRAPDPLPVGDMISSAPVRLRSRRSSGFFAHSRAKVAGLTREFSWIRPGTCM